MKNPFRRKPSEIERQIVALREASAEMNALAERVHYETSAPVLMQKLAELDPRLLDLMVSQSKYEALIGDSSLTGGQRKNAVTLARYAFDNDVQIANATKTWTDWGFGRTLDIEAVDEQANAVWTECWTAPRNQALFGQEKLDRLSHALLTDGELFFVATASAQDGETTWRTYDTNAVKEIIHPKNDDCVNVWYIVELDSGQVAIPDAFTYYALRDRFEKAELPQGVKDINDTDMARENGGTFTVIVPAQRNLRNGRGWPEFHKALSWSEVYSQMLREYSAVFSAVAMYVDKLKVKGGSRTVDSVIAALQSSLVTSTSNSYVDTNPTPAAGATWAENDAIERTRLPLGSSAGDAQTGTLTVGTQLATALRVKLSDIGRPDAFQNKATADIAAESPQQAWQRYQIFWTAIWRRVVETTLRIKSQFKKVQFSSYDSRVSTSLPMDIDTQTIVSAMDGVNKSVTAGTLPYDLANRANTALLKMMLIDLGVSSADEVVDPKPPAPAQAEAVTIGESHAPVSVRHACPLCGFGEANSYEGHGPLLVCAGCGKTYNPEVE